MKLQKLAVLIAVAASLSTLRAEESKVEVKVNDNGIKAETKVDTDNDQPRKRGVFNKSDGKILGLFPAPGSKRDREIDAELRSDKDASIEVDTDVDTDKQVFQKGDGKVLGVDVDRDRDLSAKVEGDVEVDDDSVKVETNADLDKDGNKVFRKGDGKILGIDVKRDNEARVEGDIDLDDDGIKVQADADVDRDKDLLNKNDGKVLGVDVDRNRSAEVKADVDLDDDGVKVKADADVDKDDKWVAREGTPNSQNKITTGPDGGIDADKGDGRILGLPKRGFEQVSFSKLPAVVQSTIRQHALGNKIAELELDTKDGQQVYEVEIQRDGRNQELLIATDGRLLWNTHAATGNAPGRQSGSKLDVDTDLDAPDIDKGDGVNAKVEIKKD